MKTKIIATYGPSIDNKDILKDILKYVDVVRINMSHGEEDKWKRYAEWIRDAAESLGKKISIMADLPGPKIRIGKLAEEIGVENGQEVAFAYKDYAGGKNGAIPLEYDISAHVKVGSLVYIGESGPRLTIERLENGKIICRVLNGGVITSSKGIGVRGLSKIAPPTEEDIKHAKFAIENSFDSFALSFVIGPQDIVRFKKSMGDVKVVAKIERGEAVADIDEICKEADMIMVARGDLAFDIGIEMIPIAQRKIIRAASKSHKPVIVATQILASMIDYPVPTRAEVNDIANAIWSGAEYLMLSDETTIGKYPLEAVKILSKVAQIVEEGTEEWNY